MKETVYIYNGKGVINLKGDEQETMLFFNKEPFSLTFHVELGTIWRYHLGKAIDRNFLRENYKYEQLVQHGNVKSKLSLNEQFEHITSLLTNGNYELSLSNYELPFEIIKTISVSNTNKFIDHYGGTITLIATQSYLDNTIVEQHKTNILQGFQPIAIVLKTENSWNDYIIDGHHKIHAYKQLNRSPKVLTITKLEAKKVQYSKGIKFINQLNISNDKLIERYKELYD